MSWRAEALLTDPNARPLEADLAGWARFYAWEWFDPAEPWGGSVPWGQGDGRYGGSCEQVTFQMLADEIDRLQARLKAPRSRGREAIRAERDLEIAAFLETFARLVRRRRTDGCAPALAQAVEGLASSLRAGIVD